MQRRPWAIATAATLTMLLIAAPALALRLGSSDASNDPSSQTTHRAYALLAKGFGEGFNGPLLIVAKLPSPGSAGCGTASRGVAATPGVVATAPAKINPAGNVATITAYPRSSPQAYATTQLVPTCATA